MAQLVKIGNSQGIRIPKPLIEQAHLAGKDLKLQLVNDGLLISPEKDARRGWKEAIERSIDTSGHEPLDQDWLNISLTSDNDLEW